MVAEESLEPEEAWSERNKEKEGHLCKGTCLAGAWDLREAGWGPSAISASAFGSLSILLCLWLQRDFLPKSTH